MEHLGFYLYYRTMKCFSYFNYNLFYIDVLFPAVLFCRNVKRLSRVTIFGNVYKNRLNKLKNKLN